MHIDQVQKQNYYQNSWFMKQISFQLDNHRPRFKRSWKIRSERTQASVSRPKLSLKLQRKYEQRSLPKVMIKQLNQTQFINNQTVLKSEPAYRDAQSWRLSSIHSDRPRHTRKLTNEQILRPASLSNKKEKIVFKNEAIKSRLLQKIQNHSRYLQPTELKIHSFSSKPRAQVLKVQQSKNLQSLIDPTQVQLSTQGNPSVFFKNSFFKSKEFNRMLSTRVKMILGFKKDS